MKHLFELNPKYVYETNRTQNLRTGHSVNFPISEQAIFTRKNNCYTKTRVTIHWT